MTGTTPANGRVVLGLPVRDWPVIAVTLAVATLPAVMPVMVGALMRQFGLKIDQAGFVISANMAGILLGALSSPLLLSRLSDRAILVGGLLVMSAGNGLTLIVHAYLPLLATRLFSGWGEGLAAAVGYSLMGRSSLPARTVANYAGGQALIGSVGMAALPSLTQRFGAPAFYGPITLLALASLLAVNPATRAAPRPGLAPSRGPGALRGAGGPAAMLAALFAHFAGMTTAWAFLQRIGADNGLPEPAVAAALSASAIAGLAGSLAASLLARRLSTPASLALGAVLVMACALGLAAPGAGLFAATACLLSFTWAAQYPFMFRRLAELDRQGRWTTLTPVATASALSAGPALGGMLLQRTGLASLDAAFLLLTVTGLGVTAATYFSPTSRV